MNLVEHYVECIHSIKNVTDRVNKCLYQPDLLTKYYEVIMDVNCYGNKQIVTKVLSDTELVELNIKGYYLGQEVCV